jgi:quercetin dioxygenase-like cupin family protein
MSRQRSFFFLGAVRMLAILSLTGISCPSLAEEPEKPQSTAYAYRVAFENEDVRVMQVRLKPGDTIPMHFHPHHVVYINSPGKLRFAFPEGAPLVSETKIGEVYWGPAGKNSTENIGQTEVNAIVVELKEVPVTKGKTPADLSKLPVCPL